MQKKDPNTLMKSVPCDRPDTGFAEEIFYKVPRFESLKAQFMPCVKVHDGGRMATHGVWRIQEKHCNTILPALMGDPYWVVEKYHGTVSDTLPARMARRWSRAIDEYKVGLPAQIFGAPNTRADASGLLAGWLAAQQLGQEEKDQALCAALAARGRGKECAAGDEDLRVGNPGLFSQTITFDLPEIEAVRESVSQAGWMFVHQGGTGPQNLIRMSVLWAREKQSSLFAERQSHKPYIESVWELTVQDETRTVKFDPANIESNESLRDALVCMAARAFVAPDDREAMLRAAIRKRIQGISRSL